MSGQSEGNKTNTPSVDSMEKSTSPLASISLGGIKIHFPSDLKPYKSQLTLMAKAVTGARKAQNCLLESPTGSGKTMAMLCSLLAWQKTVQKDAEEAARIHDRSSNVLTSNLNWDSTSTSVVQSPQKLEKQNRMQFIDDWSERSFSSQSKLSDSFVPSLTSEEFSRSHSPDMFELDDMEDFKPPKKKIQVISTNNETIVVNLDNNPSSSSFPNTPTTSKHLKSSTVATPTPSALPRIRVPKIFFATRTHKQITQVIRELKRTPYNSVPMTVLSSREHSCIRQLEPPYSSKNEMCRALLDNTTDNARERALKAGCFFKRNLDRISTLPSFIEGHLELETPWDIEDLVYAGKKKRLCPYFASRTLMSNAQIIFCPYNYLVDVSIRKSMGISLKDNVIVFDEAHNIEDSMRDAVSFALEESKLEQAIQECQKLIAMGGDGNVRLLQTTFQTLLSWMNDMSEKLKQENNISNDRSCTLSGTAYIAHMDNKGIGIASFENYVEAVESIFEESSQNTQEESNDEPKAEESDVKIYHLHKPSQELKIVATGLLLVWSYLYHKDFKHAEDYNIVLTERSTRTFEEEIFAGGWRGPKVSAKVQLTLNFWCMNPAVAFADFHDTHSVIVTSGTLSPMGSFQSELGVMFPHHLSTDHVIDPSQIWVASVSCGPNSKEINGTYRNAITMEYQDEIGDSILKICQVVPFGVLCFFPSYSSLENVIKRWQCTGKWQKLTECKYVIKEPRRMGEFSDAMHNYDVAVRKAEILYARGHDIPYGEHTGALFLAVFRGKVSEGIDFKDNHARAVITVSIPFPSMSDLQVKLKKKYNDTHHLKTKLLLPGNQWYEVQAYRAINQALGRCVRHRDDWGAIILLDSRFSPGSKSSSSLSKWATKEMKHFNSWPSMYSNLQQFMKRRSGIDVTKEDYIETLCVD